MLNVGLSAGANAMNPEHMYMISTSATRVLTLQALQAAAATAHHSCYMALWSANWSLFQQLQ